MSAFVMEPGGWIVSRRYDGLVFFATPLLALLLGFALVAAPQALVPVWWLWLLTLDGPHLIATLLRSVLDARDRRRHRRALLLGPLLLLPGFGALAIDGLAGGALAFDGFLLLAALWSYHHAVRQHYGVSALYQWHARPGRRDFLIDKWFLYLGLWGAFGLFMAAHPANRAVVGLAPLAGWELWGCVAFGALLAGGLLAYGGVVIGRWRRGRSVKPALFLLVAAVGVQVFSFAALGVFEPLYPAPTDPEQLFMAVTLVGGIIHSSQYFGLSFLASARRYEGGGGGLAGALGRRPGLSYGLCLLGGGVYVVLVAARGISPGWSLLEQGSVGARAFLALYWGVFFHHYYLDQHIWRVRGDGELRRELGLVEGRG